LSIDEGDTGETLDLPEANENHTKIAADMVMDAYNEDLGGRPPMTYLWQEFIHDDVEKEFISENRGHLPFIRRVMLVVLALLLAYYGFSSATKLKGDDDEAQVYKTLVPGQMAVTILSFLVTLVLETPLIRPRWQAWLGLAVLLPILTVVITNAYKFSKFSGAYADDVRLLVEACNTDGVDLKAVESQMKMLRDDKWEGTILDTVLEALDYWQSKFLVQQNRLWVVLLGMLALVLRMSFKYAFAMNLLGFLVWAGSTILSTGVSVGDTGQDIFVLGGVMVCLTLANRIYDKAIRNNFWYERVLRIRNHNLQQELDAVTQYAEPNEAEKEAVKVLDEKAFEHNIKFEDLTLYRVIGQGASGEVIKADYLGTKVVVKRMLRNNITQENLEALKTEIVLMEKLRHPNIVQLIGTSFNTISNICMVLEWVERGDLYSVLHDKSTFKEGSLTWTDPLLKMAIDIACGIRYLHAQQPPVLHRDIKSMNILITSTFGCKVTDFGMSRRAMRGIGNEDTMTAVGTPLWVPPEVIRSEPYGEKIDCWAFGVVLCEMQTRALPYEDAARTPGMTKFKLLTMIADEGLRPSLPAVGRGKGAMNSKVRELIDSLLQRDSKMRPSMEECLNALQGDVRKSIEEEDEMRMRAEEAGISQGVRDAAYSLAEEIGGRVINHLQGGSNAGGKAATSI
jgi:tRNA A-37 threonylcarbamoyl transferase component Bud32